MLVTLYTSRCILGILGEVDYGIYNLIGGIVVLFSFITNSMTTSTQRFLNYNIGLNDEHKTKIVFSSARLAHFVVLIIFLIFSETIGLWFVNHRLNIPIDRIETVNWVYQTSIISSCFGVIVIPYRASIIASERMSIFAYTSIGEVLLRLIFVLCLPLFHSDKLIIFVILYNSVSIISFYVHKYICKKALSYTRGELIWNKKQFYELLTFSGWYLLGGIAMVGSKQGINIIINLFFNVVLNAAVGIANQVNSAIYSFITNFQTAFSPQLVSLYAKNKLDDLKILIFKSTKFSFFLILIISTPIIFYCPELLRIWLVKVPSYSVSFARLVILTSFFDALSAPLWTVIGATGKVKKYQLFVSFIILASLPIIYILFYYGFTPQYAFGINLIFNGAAYVYRFYYLKKIIEIDSCDYFKKIICPCSMTAASIIVFGLILRYFSHISFVINIILIFIVSLLAIIILGLTKHEKGFVKSYLVRLINRND